MGKAPADQFYWNDWLSDVQLQQASACAKGVWINALCRMWYNNPRGELHGSKESLIKLCICNQDEFETFLKDAKALGFCEVSQDSNSILTIQNRRMYREEKKKESARLRQQRYYDKHKPNSESNGVITPPSSSSPSSSSSSSNSLREEGSQATPLESDIESKIEDLKKEISKLVKRNVFNPYEFDNRNGKKHPEARLQVLTRAKQEIEKGNQKFLKDPWRYLTHIMTVEHQNANEREAFVEHDAKKAEFEKMVDKLK